MNYDVTEAAPTRMMNESFSSAMMRSNSPLKTSGGGFADSHHTVPTDSVVGPLFSQDPLFEAFSTSTPATLMDNRIPLYMRKNASPTCVSPVQSQHHQAMLPYGFAYDSVSCCGAEASTSSQAHIYSWANASQPSKMPQLNNASQSPFSAGLSSAKGFQNRFLRSPTASGDGSKISSAGFGSPGFPAGLERVAFRPIASGTSPTQTPTPTPPRPGFLSQSEYQKLSKTPPVTCNTSGPSDPNQAQGGRIIQESVGGTTYFFDAEEASYYHPSIPVMENAYVYPGPSSHLANLKQKGGGVASFFISNELKMELVHRHILMAASLSPEQFAELPQEVDTYHNLFPLEPIPKTTVVERPGYFGYVTTNFRATNTKDGLAYCLRRIHGFRLANTKCMGVVEMWKKNINHSNVVHLREMFTTKAFGEHSLVFAYDYHPGAETLKYRHFSGIAQMNGFRGGQGGGAGTPNSDDGQSKARNIVPPMKTGVGAGTLLPEPLIWCYVVQLCSALRAIHSAGLAARTVDPSKILVFGKSKLLLNCCGMLDILTFDHTQANPMGMMQHYQQEDLTGLGRLVLALSCNSLLVMQRDHMGASIDLVSRHYSQDLKNLILYLLTPQQRPRSVNDIMPMIGARFFSQLDAAQTKIDMLENELAKEVENGRLCRLLCKLGIINERPEYGLDAQWSETGDRYLLKLFRDYLFHQVTEDGRPWIDVAHIVQCLNKLDAGAPEKISLMSRDEQNVLIVSYADLKRCVENSFGEVLLNSVEIR